MKTITEIKKEFETLSESDAAAFLDMYASDERSGVRALCERIRKKQTALEKEIRRTESLKVFEKKYEHLGYVCGIDEVGRGPLAGPVLACAVILPKDSHILYLNDSKKLSAAKREELYEVILREAVAVGTGMASPQRIDEINILQATYEAMRQAVDALPVAPQVLVNDAVTIPGILLPQVPIIKGDARSVSIAAASIVAKVTRDRMMDEYDKLMPEYGFASNKGYGTQEHIDALKKYGPSPIHRQTFITHFV
ncbi:MAG: ribonuclease HII [Blautia sp.]|nr:ribonuclease HII [Blautia sp.]